MIIILFISTQCIYSQDKLHLFYITDTKIELKECNYNGLVISGNDSMQSIPANSKFTIVNKKDDMYVVDFWTWGISDSLEKLTNEPNLEYDFKTKEYKYFNINYKVENGKHVTRYFLINDYQFEKFVSKLKSKIEPTVGTIVLPVKLRINPSDFSKDFTISGTGGVKLNISQKHDLSVSFLVGLGISSVSLDSATTNNSIKDSQDRAAITALGGVVLQWQFLQLGTFVGGDWLARNNIDNWIYQGKPWFGFGIGVSLFSKDVSAKSEGKN